MKKFLMVIFAVLLVFPALAFAGCGKDNSIAMKTYFKEKIEYTLYQSGSTILNDIKAEDYFDDKVNHLNDYTSLTFFCSENWIYKFYLEKVTFEIYSNIDLEVQFIITIKNLKNGDPTGEYQEFTKAIPVVLKHGKATKVSIKVEDYFKSQTNTSYIKIEPQDRVYFEENGVKTGLKYDVLNLKFYGEHNATYKY